MKGNIVDLAVAFVIGVAFAAVVNSLVDDLIMPIIAMIIGKPDFSDLTFTINDAVFRYGAFLTSVITFVDDRGSRLLRRRQADGCDQGADKAGQEEEAISDEERRHQELLVALNGGRRAAVSRQGEKMER